MRPNIEEPGFVSGQLGLSVALPVCDNHRFIEAAVRSIFSQSLAADEVVIGDDGSNDGTSDILARLAAEFPRIRLLRRERRSGLANAANWVVGETRGALVALAHADDLSHPDRFAAQVAALDMRPDVVLVGAPAIGIDRDGNAVHPPNLWRLLHPSVFAPFTHSSIMFRRQAFFDAGGYRAHADYWEDLDLFWRLARLGPILVLPRSITSYRYSDDSFRSRDRAADIENAVHFMYDRAADAAAGDLAAALSIDHPHPPHRIHPRVFIARSWTAIWTGQRPYTFHRLWRHGALRLDQESVLALAFVGGCTVAPRAMRRMLQGAARLRDIWVRAWLAQDQPAEWRPFRRSDCVSASSPNKAVSVATGSVSTKVRA